MLSRPTNRTLDRRGTTSAAEGAEPRPKPLARSREGRTTWESFKEVAPVKALLPIAVVLMLLGAAMLLANIGAAGLWIAIIAVGIALVALTARNSRRLLHR